MIGFFFPLTLGMETLVVESRQLCSPPWMFWVAIGCPGLCGGRGVSLAGQQGLDSSHPFWYTFPPASLHLEGLKIKHNPDLPPTHPQKLFPLVSEIGKLRYCWH